MLGNFGKLNGLWGTRENARLAVMLDELLPLAAERAGGLAWEYYFTFGGGRPPWVSGLAQGRPCRRWRARPRGCGGRPTCCRSPSARWRCSSADAEGVRVPAESGDHYAIYSFAPGLRVLNGFIQSLIGLLRLRAAVRRPARRRAVRGRRAGGAPRGPALRHRRLVAVLARQLDARVRPRLPRPAAGLPREPVRAHRPGRLLHDGRELRHVQVAAAGGRGRVRGACAAASRAAWRSSSRRSRT